MLAAGQPHPAGVNGQVSAVLTDAAGNQAVLNTTIFSTTPTTGVIAGTAATLTIPGPYYQPGDMTLTSATGEVLTYSEPAIGHDGLYFEAAEVARCITAGLLESPLRPLLGLDRHHAGGRRDPPAARDRVRRGALTRPSLQAHGVAALHLDRCRSARCSTRLADEECVERGPRHSFIDSYG